jgi:hypothetical protein
MLVQPTECSRIQESCEKDAGLSQGNPCRRSERSPPTQTTIMSAEWAVHFRERDDLSRSDRSHSAGRHCQPGRSRSNSRFTVGILPWFLGG